ncbi:MAG: hypothetical protein M1833_003367 [Piccolia ochrophora]|nr:MAG: hypothetical protein M1833_003367 [Piccolia ochrophora]
MHSIKSRARQCAWYNREGDPPTYNPWAKFKGRHARDEEKGLNRIASESNAKDRLQGQRLQEGAGNERGIQPASTFPPDASQYINRSSVEEPARSIEKSSPASDDPASEPVSLEDASPTGASKPRHRILAKFSRHTKDQQSDSGEDSNGKAKPRQKFTVLDQVRATLFNSWINVLLIAVPAGLIVNYLHVDPVVIFTVNFIAIIPLAALLSYATEEIALRVGETLGGLLNATFGNAVELIVSLLALFKGEYLIVQTSLIGSILSNLLLVMGMAFFLGGLKHVEQFFNVTVAQTAASLLALAVGSLIIPPAFHIWAQGGSEEDRETQIRSLSRGTAVILLLVYGCYLLFQLKTHSVMFSEASQKGTKRQKNKGEAHQGIAQMGAGLAGTAGGETGREAGYKGDEDDVELPQLSVLSALITLGASTALVALCAEFMVSSIDELTTRGRISKTFVGLILLPIVGNAAEHATAVTVAIKDKMDLAIGVAVGSSMQIALFVTPFIVVLGWIAGKDGMTLDFDGFQVTVLFVAVLLVNYLIQDGKSHWLEGILLCATYIIIAVAAFYYPPPPEHGESG